MKRLVAVGMSVALAMILLAPGGARAQAKEILLGGTGTYSGPYSAWATFSKTMSAYFNKINADGGIDGVKVNYLSYDDAYNPSKALEQHRRLVERDKVLAIFGTGGTANNTAIMKYLNSNKVPQLFVISGGPQFADPVNAPWTIGWQPTFDIEARIYAKHALSVDPSAKIAVLYQNDDLGRVYVNAVKEVLGPSRQGQLVEASSFELTDPSVDTNVIAMSARGANVLISAAGPKFVAQAIKKAAEIGWRPKHYIYTGSGSISLVLAPAGLEASKGVMTGAFLRDPSDPEQQKTKEYRDYEAFMKKYYPEGKVEEPFNVWAYSMTQTMEYVLRQAGGDFSRENLMRKATSIKGLELPMLIPGIVINTSPTDYRPVQSMQLQGFDGTRWQRFGGIIDG